MYTYERSIDYGTIKGYQNKKNKKNKSCYSPYILQQKPLELGHASNIYKPGGQTPVFPENIRRTLHSQYILFDLLLRTRR